MKKHTALLGGLFFSFVVSMAMSASAQDAVCGKTDYDCQIKGYNAQIAADPKNSELYYALGISLQGKGDYMQAIAAFDKYIVSGVNDPAYLADGYNYRAFSYERAGKKELAIRDYTSGIGLVPTRVSFYQKRGNLYSEMKNFGAAVTDLTRAISLKKDDSTSYFGRGVAYMGLKNNELALADFNQSLFLNSIDPENYYNRGTVYFRLENYPKAIVDLDKYISLNDAGPAALADGYYIRGSTFFNSGNTMKALEDLTKAIELAPKLKNAYVNRALVYRKQGKIALAEADEAKAAGL